MKTASYKYKHYLAHKNEPIDIDPEDVPRDIEAELLANRYLLKRRVWRQARRHGYL